MGDVPSALEELVREIEATPVELRAELLIEYADKFATVPAGIAVRPYPEEHRVQACESEAYVWSEQDGQGRMKFHFAVENPQGISAKALSVILGQALDGQPAEQVSTIPTTIVNRIFGRELSMGKGTGLQGIVRMVTGEARRRIRG